MAILVLNPGSTTLKFALIEADGTILEHSTVETDRPAEVARALLRSHPDLEAVGCRVVHGGQRFTEPTEVTQEMVQVLEELDELAPLHNPPATSVLRACLSETSLPLIAVFDTAFHASLPAVARTYGINYETAQQYGLHRYGFHGIAHQATSATLEWVMGEHGLPRARLVTCQLGGGASICAILNRKSVDTSMGFTPLEGIMMTTRSGDLDPGIVLHLVRHGWDGDKIENLLNHESGFAGVSGLGVDPRDLLTAMDEGNERARLALELYAYRIAKYIASFTVPLGGLDGIGFSGGIGQNSARIRAMICDHLGHLGVFLDQELNYAGEPVVPRKITGEESRVAVWAIPTEEERAIAQCVREHLGS